MVRSEPDEQKVSDAAKRLQAGVLRGSIQEIQSAVYDVALRLGSTLVCRST